MSSVDVVMVLLKLHWSLALNESWNLVAGGLKVVHEAETIVQGKPFLSRAKQGSAINEDKE
jgi:hypothetical protein